MATAYRYVLSSVVEGHSNDVRCVCAFKGGCSLSNGIISGSRDSSARLWMPKDGGKESKDSDDSLKQWSLRTIFKGHTNYVSCVAFMDPDENHPEGSIYTGCHDGKIRAYDPRRSDPMGVLEGHTSTVSKVFVSCNKTLLSSSWDSTARVWVNDASVMVLKGHSAAVWCAAILPKMGGVMVTGSADKTIKLWRTGTCQNTLSRHTQAVRDLGVLGPNQFVSCGNDGNIFVWQVVEDSFDSNVIYEFNCQDFVYSITIMPCLETANSLATDWVSSGENGALKVFHQGRVDQEIVIPALSVWSVTVIKNGDLAAACSDNRIYIFTQDKGRMAPPDMLALFDAEVEKHKGSANKNSTAGSELPEEIGGVKTADMPGPDVLNYPGKRDGQTKMIRDGNIVTVYSWSSGKQAWDKVGDVVGQPDKTGETPAPGSKVMFEGQEYDHVFNVDVDEGVVLKLPYNNSEEPYIAAQRFIHRHNLPQDYLDQVAQFVTKNSSGGPIISQGYSGDPLTGGSAYVSGSGGVKASSFTNRNGVSDPFTGAGAYSTMMGDSTTGGSGNLVPKYYPQTTFLSFAQVPKLEALTKKLLEFNEGMPPYARLEEDQLIHLVKLHDTEKVMAADVPLLLRVLRWPKGSAFNPMLDVVRLAILNEMVAGALLDNESTAAEFTDVIISHVADKAKSTNQMLAVKVLTNMFLRPSGLKLLMGLREVVLQQISVLLPTDNKSAQASIATLILNYSIASTKLDSGATDFSEAQKQCLTLISLLLDGLTDPESQFRALVALGTLIHSSPGNVAFSKGLDMKERVKNLHIISETAKIKEICNDLIRAAFN